MEKTAIAAKEFVDLLMEETDNIKKLVLPALNEALKEVRDVRMAISNEATTILNSYGTLRKTAEYTEQLTKLADAIRHLALTVENVAPGTKAKLADLFDETSHR